MILPRTSEGLYLLQRVRDEAHRFAITHHRSRRSKSMVESLLDDVPGLGEVRRKTLLKHFGSLKQAPGGHRRRDRAWCPASAPRTATAIKDAVASSRARKTVSVNTATGEIDERADASEHVPEHGGRGRRARRRHRHDRRRPQHRRQGARGPRLLRRRQPAARACCADVVRLVDESQRRRSSRSRSSSTSAPASFFDVARTANLAQGATGRHTTLLFLEATDDVLVRRQEAARRPHPLQGDGRLLDGLAARARGARPTCAATPTWSSTPPTSTSTSSPTGSPRRSATPDATRLKITVVSFGFKYGIPVDADFVADMRFLPNPYWVPELRPHDRPRRRRSPTTSWASRAPRSSSTRYVAGARAASPTGYLARGQAVHDRRHRLHRRQAPQRRDDRGDRRAGCASAGIDAEAIHRDLGRE